MSKKKATTISDGKLSKFSEIKKGEYFKFAGGATVYVFDGGGPVRGFKYYKFKDVNAIASTKTDREIEIGFTF